MLQEKITQLVERDNDGKIISFKHSFEWNSHPEKTVKPVRVKEDENEWLGIIIEAILGFTVHHSLAEAITEFLTLHCHLLVALLLSIAPFGVALLSSVLTAVIINQFCKGIRRVLKMAWNCII